MKSKQKLCHSSLNNISSVFVFSFLETKRKAGRQAGWHFEVIILICLFQLYFYFILVKKFFFIMASNYVGARRSSRNLSKSACLANMVRPIFRSMRMSIHLKKPIASIRNLSPSSSAHHPPDYSPNFSILINRSNDTFVTATCSTQQTQPQPPSFGTRPASNNRLNAVDNNGNTNIDNDNSNAHSYGESNVIDINDMIPFHSEWPTSGLKYALSHNILGRGRYGTVVLATCCQTRKHVAIKFINLKEILTSVHNNNNNEHNLEFARYEWKQLNREINIQSQLCTKHPNIVQLQYAYFNTDYAFIVLELAEISLHSEMFLHKALNRHRHSASKLNRVGLREKRAKRIAYDVACGLRFIHNKGFMHRDIKLENTLLVGRGKYEMAKIADFGLAVKLNEHGVFDGPTLGIGTKGSMAPEIFSAKLNDHNVGPKADWFSFGVLIFRMLFEVKPFPDPVATSSSSASGTHQKNEMGMNEEHVPHVLPPLKFPKTWAVSKAARTLIEGLLQEDVNKRFGAKEVFEHRWFRHVDVRR